MNWDKKVVNFQHERGINATQLGPAEAIAANRQARIIARWQREQLRTHEAVERVARAICRRNWPKDSDFEYYWRRYGDDFRADARAAIDALLGTGDSNV